LSLYAFKPLSLESVLLLLNHFRVDHVIGMAVATTAGVRSGTPRTL